MLRISFFFYIIFIHILNNAKEKVKIEVKKKFAFELSKFKMI